MTDFVISCFKGTYLYFSILAVVVIIYRIRTRRWKAEETLILSLFLALYAGTLLQIFAADRIVFVSRRYLLPLAPLLFGFAAWGLVTLYDRYRYSRLWAGLAIVVACLLLLDALMPTIKEYSSPRRRTENRSIKALADFIQSDYRETRRGKEPPRWWYEPRFPSRPILKGAPPQLTYRVGGGNWNEYFPDEPFDYLIVQSGQTPADKTLCKIFSIGRYQVFKARKTEAVHE